MSIVELKVPTIGESITEVTLSAWLKKEGDYVNLDEPICEFESDKATLEFPSEAAGQLTQIAEEGEDLEIGALVAKIDTSVKAPTEAESVPADDAGAEDAPVEEDEKSEEKDSYASGHPSPAARSEEHTSELHSRGHLVC